jgi:hypothetical protein
MERVIGARRVSLIFFRTHWAGGAFGESGDAIGADPSIGHVRPDPGLSRVSDQLLELFLVAWPTFFAILESTRVA